ncbi:AraC family transcriptional regulator [Domibacillus enclensis]|uniref:AraC family transcriptional regulator n=1 Tax=Domibacillus enclensis TaxID=1017273 RepID=A0A1N6VAQ7_9BACI|nr:AraC family transcriptional regulator [Domibacillus enclensis]OXS78738.1 AraC family transcriptional regulator [Domibacillus enclensis]SIQ74973.1 AraC-like ligand binding domain-containing protein [Domibacillus enclensis]
MIERGVLSHSKMFFHTPSEFAKTSLFYLIYSGTFYCTSDYCIDRNNWNSYLFMHVKKGSITIHYDDREFVATENHFVFLNCYKPHLYQADEQTEFDWFHFSGNASDSYFDTLFQKNGCVYAIEDHYVLTDCLKRILRMTETEAVDEDAASIMIHQILYELKQYKNHGEEVHLKAIRNVTKYIEHHYKEPIMLDDMAKVARLSPYYFSRIFKKQMNCSPYQYLVNYRINNAKKLLHHTNLSVQEITYASGFNSVSHFVSIFKKHTNLTPKKFRDIQF